MPIMVENHIGVHKLVTKLHIRFNNRKIIHLFNSRPTIFHLFSTYQINSTPNSFHLFIAQSYFNFLIFVEIIFNTKVFSCSFLGFHSLGLSFQFIWLFLSLYLILVFYIFVSCFLFISVLFLNLLNSWYPFILPLFAIYFTVAYHLFWFYFLFNQLIVFLLFFL